MKKFLTITLVLTLVLGLFAGCKKPNETQGPGEKVALKIGIPTDANILDLKDNALTKWVEETCNVELTFEEYAPGEDGASQISTTTAAGNPLPDILIGISLDYLTINKYGKDEYFADLTEYFEDKDGKSKIFWDRMADRLTEAEQDIVWSRMNKTDKIYAIPVVETSMVDNIYYQTYINTEWLDALDMEMPTNNEELYDFLVAVRDGDPNGNGDTTDEIPLYGTQTTYYGARAIDWLINTYIYYHIQHKWQPDENGKLVHVQTTDEYRDAMGFIAKLYDEGLLTNQCLTATYGEMMGIITPLAGEARVGIFLGHMSVNVDGESPIINQYQPLPYWSCAAEKDIYVDLSTFITTDCKNIDKAFEVCMALWSEEGSLRMRYGEYGKNWTDADEGAVSMMGVPADFKLIDDPYTKQNSARWGYMATLNYYAEAEGAQIDENADAWTKKKNEMHGQIRNLFTEAAEKYNPEVLCPPLNTTVAEDEAISLVKTNVNDYLSTSQTNFIKGIEDVTDDTVWNAYLAKLDELGIDDYQAYVQTAYDRQVK